MSDEINTLNVKVISIDLDTEIEKKDGGTYRGAQVIFTVGGKPGTKAVTQKGLEFNPELKKDLKSFKTPGEAVLILERKNGFNNLKRLVTPDNIPTNISSTRKSPAVTVTSKSSGGYDVQGAIKGNAVTNGVQIAISQGDTSLANIVKNAKIVLEAHKVLDNAVEEVKEEPVKTESKKAKIVTVEEDVDTDDLF
jgi:hypothetical protein